jgi:hypothetical protein
MPRALSTGMRSLCVATLLATATTAAIADPSTTLQAEPAKLGQLAGATIATKAFGHGRIDVLDLAQPEFGEHDLRVAITDGAQWWGATHDIAVLDVDCATGKCLHEALDGVTIDVVGGVAWIRFALVGEVRHNDAMMRDRDRDTRATAVMGCALPKDGGPPRCALFDPGVWQSSSVALRGSTLTVHGELAQTVEFAF